MDDLHRIQRLPSSARSHDVETADDSAATKTRADDPVPGPSNLPFRNASLLGGNYHSKSSSSSISSAGKVRQRPAKLALVSASIAGAPSKRVGGNAITAPDLGTGGQASHDSTGSSRSMPSSPNTSITSSSRNMTGVGIASDSRDDLRDTLRGAPRRRPSILFPLAHPNAASSGQSAKTPRLLPTLNIQAARQVAPDTSDRPNNGGMARSPVPSAGLPPSVWQDPSEHILSGNGSSLQHARSSYASGPIEVLPGLFLGDEFNACDEAYLIQHGITTILNVAKETTLPCQADDSCRDLGFFQQANTLAKGFGKKLSLFDEAATPTSAGRPQRLATAQADQESICPTPATETFYTPATSSFAQQSFIFSPRSYASPMQNSEDSARSSLYLRNTSSTPNLQAAFQATKSAALHLPGSYRPERYTSSSSDGEAEEDDDEMLAEGESAATSSLASHVSTHTEESATSSPHYDGQKLSPFDEVSATTPSSSTFSRRSPATVAASTTCSSSSSAGSFTIALPSNAVALSVPPSPMAGRTWPIRYVKLPWTHDETDLANPSTTGGFVTGCAIIADALGIEARSGQRMNNGDFHRPGAAAAAAVSGGGVLVHCQCGVSRSATLVIAFVMQAAAYEYDFERTRDLTGMHDCYEMVKSISSSISPNISLIYQLVEWERVLSRQVAQRHLDVVAEEKFVPPMDERSRMDALNNEGDGGGVVITSNSSHTPPPPPTTERRWGKEVMDEEDWMRMRAEEERKEEQASAVDDKQRQLDDVRVREAEWRAAQRQQATHTESDGFADASRTKPAVPALSFTSGAGIGARRKKPSPSLTLVNSSKVSADHQLPSVAATLPTQESDDGGQADVTAENEQQPRSRAFLLTPPSESEEDGDAASRQVPVRSGGDMQKSHSEAAPLTPGLTDAALKRTGSEQQTRASSNTLHWLQSERGPSSSSSSSTSSSRPNSGYGIASFGAIGQSAAERRMKHKRTFSAEVPDWDTILHANHTNRPSNRKTLTFPLKRSQLDKQSTHDDVDRS